MIQIILRGNAKLPNNVFLAAGCCVKNGPFIAVNEERA